MQLVSISALSAFVIAAAGLVQATPAAHDANIVQRASHRRSIRDLQAVKARSPVPATLKKKRSSSEKEKRCRVRSTTTVVATVTASSTSIPDATAVVDGIDNASSHHHHSSSDGANPTANPTGDNTGDNTPAPTATGSYNSQWSLAQSRQGDTFFDQWQFWDQADPTNGNVQFVDQGTAQSEGLVSVTNGQAFMRADTSDNVGNRKAIRITDNYAFNDNTLIIMDAAHMPTGCGTWPAFWANLNIYFPQKVLLEKMPFFA